MRLVDLLKEDHKAMDLMSKILENICGKLQSLEKVESEHLDRILAFMKDFVVPHNGVGESLVLSAVEEAGVPMERGAFIAMGAERNTLREYTAYFQEAVAKYRHGDPDAPELVVHIARSYIAALERQMEMQERSIYPRLDIYLSTAQQRELTDRFKRSETPARLDALERLSRIKDAYPSAA